MAIPKRGKRTEREITMFLWPLLFFLFSATSLSAEVDEGTVVVERVEVEEGLAELGDVVEGCEVVDFEVVEVVDFEVVEDEDFVVEVVAFEVVEDEVEEDCEVVVEDSVEVDGMLSWSSWLSLSIA